MQVDFNAKAREWDSNPLFIQRGLKIAEAIHRQIPLSPAMHALDYGCGTGLLSFPLKEMLGHITLTDSAPGMLEVLKEKIAAQKVRNMSVLHLDLTRDSPPDDRYDVIYTAMTLHHIPDTAKILTVFHDLLNASGYLCIADLDAEDGSFHGPDVDVHPGFDRAALAALAGQVGFKDIRFTTVFEIEKTHAHGSHAYPVFLMIARRG